MTGTLTTKCVLLEVTDCCVCGVEFAMPKQMLDERRRTGAYFYCPSGHLQHFTETTADRLRKELARRERELDWAKARATSARDQAAATHRSNVALRGHLTRARKRAAGGCKRTFVELARHMATKHPSYAEDGA
jgi:hypothetical protein